MFGEGNRVRVLLIPSNPDQTSSLTERVYGTTCQTRSYTLISTGRGGGRVLRGI